MTYREKLVKFIIAKRALINLYTELDYINNEDIEEIKSWPEEKCKIVYEHIVKYIIKSIDVPISTITDDSITCPWCVYISKIKKYNDCDSCGYGKRNGVCDKFNSKYRQITDEGGFTFITKKDYLNIINNIGN